MAASRRSSCPRGQGSILIGGGRNRGRVPTRYRDSGGRRSDVQSRSWRVLGGSCGWRVRGWVRTLSPTSYGESRGPATRAGVPAVLASSQWVAVYRFLRLCRRSGQGVANPTVPAKPMDRPPSEHGPRRHRAHWCPVEVSFAASDRSYKRSWLPPRSSPLGGQAEGQRGGPSLGQDGPSWGQARPIKGPSGGQAGGQAHDEEGQAGIRAGPSRGQAAIPPLSSRDLGILRAAEAGPTSRKTLLVAGKYSRRSGSFRRRLARLVAGRLLEMTLPNKPTSPSQRYRLTREGRAALASVGHRHGERLPPRAGAKSSLHTGE